jgi:hypothetical protein
MAPASGNGCSESYWTFVAAGALLIVPIWALMTVFPDPLGLMLPEVSSERRSAPLPGADDGAAGPALVFTALALLPAIEQPGKATLVSVSRQLLLVRAGDADPAPPHRRLAASTTVPPPSIFLCALWLLAIVLTPFKTDRRAARLAERTRIEFRATPVPESGACSASVLVLGHIRGIRIEIHVSWLVIFVPAAGLGLGAGLNQAYPDWSWPLVFH